MNSGRPAKPLELKLKQGNPGKRALPEMTTVAVAYDTPPKPPASLKQAGKKVWNKIWAGAAMWLGPSDEPAVLLTCEIADQIATLKRKYAATKKPEMALQWFWAIQKAQKELLIAYGQLGLTPTARAKLGLVVAQVAETESRLQHFTRRAG